MKKLFILAIILTSLKVNADSWTPKAIVNATHTSVPTSFSIGNNGYVCNGYGNTDTISRYLWAYNSLTDVWTQKADFAGGNTLFTTSFAIQGKGYVGLGENFSGKVKTMWQYDTLTNAWTQKTIFLGANGLAPVLSQLIIKGIFLEV